MTIKESSDFWDEHSRLDFEGTEKAEVKFKLTKKRYIGLDRKLFQKLDAYARRQNVTAEALLESRVTAKVR